MKKNYQILENDKPLDIRKDNVFKAVFTKQTYESRTALSKLVSALIGRDVTIDTIVANEPPIDSLGERKIRFDINCVAENGERINVEMSFHPKPYEPVRLEYHASKLLTTQEISGIEKGYNDLKQTYQIAILAKRRFFADKEIFHTFLYYDPVHNVSLEGKTRIITIELSKVKTIAKKPIEDMEPSELWAFYFQNLTKAGKCDKINEILNKSEGIAMANEVLMRISREEEERIRIMSEEKFIKDRESEIAYKFKKVLTDKDAKIAQLEKQLAEYRKP
ncbi:MAG: Rpn family recombination-promoting nuclease/putative transposase [Fibromonadaceae bacterium]|jgi:predicted transposase/invertase (TIGR01784 family)|nr:Rpn family recombination-promoting nuclease/putative transposase [Fibromonadaceae bacterium]